MITTLFISEYNHRPNTQKTLKPCSKQKLCRKRNKHTNTNTKTNCLHTGYFHLNAKPNSNIVHIVVLESCAHDRESTADSDNKCHSIENSFQNISFIHSFDIEYFNLILAPAPKPATSKTVQNCIFNLVVYLCHSFQQYILKNCSVLWFFLIRMINENYFDSRWKYFK